MTTTKDKEKEKVEKLKAMRQEIQDKLEEQLPETMLDEKSRVEVHKISAGHEVSEEEAPKIIEAILFASQKPMTVAEIRKVVRSLTVKQITAHIATLKEQYESMGHAFEVVEIAGGFEIATKKEYAPWILKNEIQKKAKQVTQSALETMAILAYRQPMTRAEIEELRGVDVSGVMNTLMERGFVKISGKKEVPGRPFLYGTTEKFLEHFGLKNLSDLPDIEEIRNLVENSVKKDELLGTQKIVEVPEEGAAEEAQPEETPAEPAPEIDQSVLTDPLPEVPKLKPYPKDIENQAEETNADGDGRDSQEDRSAG